MTHLPVDTVSTIGEGGKRLFLYPQILRGKYLRARTSVAIFLIVVYVAAPWIDLNGYPALHFDIPHRRFHVFGLSLFASDASYLLFLFGFVVFSVFLFTALLGRVWCGWACPQTVFLESVVRPIEEWFEGKPHERKGLDRAPWTLEKFWRKALKWSVFLTIAGMVGTSFTAYFLGRYGTLEAQFHPTAHPLGTAFFLGITGVLMFDFAYFREQTCIVVCPYGRFQSVLMDQHSLGVGYDARRGEPRGKLGTSGAGDCVDCKKCLAVCPTGIDIRRGTQMECVGCLACIDACDDIMAQVGKPQGLIRLSSEALLRGEPRQILRPRVVAYGSALVVLVLVSVFVLAERQVVEIRLTREVGPSFLLLPDGAVQNVASLRLSNKDTRLHRFSVRVLSPTNVTMTLPNRPVEVPIDETLRTPIFLVAPPGGPRQRDVVLRVSDDSGFVEQVTHSFLAPGHGD